jgi:hypothetical protein
MAWQYSTSDGHRGIQQQQHLVIELDATGHRGSSMAWEHSTSDGHHGIQQHLVIELDATGHRGSSMAWENSTSDGHHGIQQQHLVIELPSPTVCTHWVNVGRRVQTMGESRQTGRLKESLSTVSTVPIGGDPSKRLRGTQEISIPRVTATGVSSSSTW